MVLIPGATFNAHANNVVNCALDTDCTFSSYNDWIYIPTVEKADYKCHITQKNNVCKDVSKMVINSLTGGDSKTYHYPVQTIDLGGDAGNDTNMYFPARVISENASLRFFVEDKE